jgi:hypothetical protein
MINGKTGKNREKPENKNKLNGGGTTINEQSS